MAAAMRGAVKSGKGFRGREMSMGAKGEWQTPETDGGIRRRPEAPYGY